MARRVSFLPGPTSVKTYPSINERCQLTFIKVILQLGYYFRRLQGDGDSFSDIYDTVIIRLGLQ